MDDEMIEFIDKLKSLVSEEFNRYVGILKPQTDQQIREYLIKYIRDLQDLEVKLNKMRPFVKRGLNDSFFITK